MTTMKRLNRSEQHPAQPMTCAFEFSAPWADALVVRSLGDSGCLGGKSL
jgi:hypothetical protein